MPKDEYSAENARRVARGRSSVEEAGMQIRYDTKVDNLIHKLEKKKSRMKKRGPHRDHR